MTDYSILKEAESNENQEITIFGNTVNLQEEEENQRATRGLSTVSHP